jgi:EAL domain-containing protein (putative c-di-GMP-specific phosphodiesterase class I)
MLSAIVQLARAMKLLTIAECVESDAICAVTRSLGVDYGQGFSLGRPVPLEKVLGELVAANIGVRLPVTQTV